MIKLIWRIPWEVVPLSGIDPVTTEAKAKIIEQSQLLNADPLEKSEEYRRIHHWLYRW